MTDNRNGPFLEHHRSQSVFLCEQPAVTKFVTLWTQLCRSSPYPPSAAIVCERKEDIIAVRAQIAHEICARHSGPQALGGLSTYTLDGLARALAQWLHFALLRLGRTGAGSHSRAESPGKNGDEIRFGNLTAADLGRDYLDAVTQEKLVRHVLLASGYSGSDALPLAKQLLTLVDQPLPEGVTLLQCLAPLRRSGLTGQVDEAHLSSISIMLCALQTTDLLLAPAHFMRLQTLLMQGFARCSDGLLDDLHNALHPTLPCVTGPMLWVEAPHYGFSETAEAHLYKPGNFDARIVADLFAALQNIRQRARAGGQIENPTFVAETHIRAKKAREAAARAKVIVHGDLLHFYRGTAEHLGSVAGRGQNAAELGSCGALCALRGDVPLEHLRALHPSAAGTYVVPPHDVENFLNRRAHQALLEPSHTALKALAQESAVFDEMLLKVSPEMQSISEVYGLAKLAHGPSERFRILARECGARVRSAAAGHPLETLPQALSLVASRSRPARIDIYGKPHMPRQASYNVRILNHIFHELKQRGADVAPPASDIMYQVFWLALFQGDIPLEVHLVDEREREDLEHFAGQSLTRHTLAAAALQGAASSPQYQRIRNALQRNTALAGAYFGAPGHREHPGFLRVTDWPSVRSAIAKERSDERSRHRQAGAQSQQTVHLSMTAFEAYTQCPLAFYMRHVLQLGSELGDDLHYDRMRAGTRTHRTLELLATGLNLARSSTNPVFQQGFASRFLASWYSLLTEPTTFQTSKAQVFYEAAEAALTEALSEPPSEQEPSLKEPDAAAFLGAMKDVVDSVFCETPAVFSDLLDLEARKRLLVAYLHAESCRFQEDLAQGLSRQVAFVEEPLALELGGGRTGRRLRLEGKADRIDVLYETRDSNAMASPRCIEIIDYKTSAPKDNETSLDVFPQPFGTSLSLAKGHHRSVQGGLYLTAFLRRQAGSNAAETCMDKAEMQAKSTLERQGASCLHRFSLFRLASLNGSSSPFLAWTFDPSREPGRSAIESGMARLEEHAEKLLQGDFPARPDTPSRCTYCDFVDQCPASSLLADEEDA